jgi:NAD(P)-dependent dehydrogenase (short-subunit alcohol dehydrogenase family)
MELRGRTAVITGGASGIGLATARAAAAAGMSVVIGDIEEAALRAATAELREGGAAVEGVRCDVRREEDLVNLREAAIGAFGAAHLIFNNAGVAAGPAVGTPKAVWDWVLAVNVDGVINGINAFVPYFLERGEGHVVSTASLAGLGGVPGMGAYCASKFAVVGISESLFHELILHGGAVGVSVLCPGFVRTRIHESHRNIPDELVSYLEDPVAQMVGQAAAEAVSAGIDPAEVADEVLAAVEANRFWILPHERVALRTTELRLAWMRGGPPPGIDLGEAARR